MGAFLEALSGMQGEQKAPPQQADVAAPPTAASSGPFMAALQGMQSADASPPPQQDARPTLAGIGPDPVPGFLRNLLLGGLKGATNIGQTFLRLPDFFPKMQTSAMDPEQRALVEQQRAQDAAEAAQRTAAIKNFFAQYANQSSFPFKAGETAVGIAGTAAVPQVLGAAAAPFVPARLASAIASGGFNIGAKPLTGSLVQKAAQAGTNLALRATGGAVAGGASAGLIEPETAPAGALVGAAIPVAATAAGAAGSGLRQALGWGSQQAVGGMTGAGSETIKQAYEAGRRGDLQFLDAMRGRTDMEDIVDSFKQGLNALYEQRAVAYKNGMAQLSNDKSVIPMDSVEQALARAKSIGSEDGIWLSKEPKRVFEEISEIVDQWKAKAADNPEMLSPYKMDKLKQAVGDIMAGTKERTVARKVAGEVYSTIRSEIANNAPVYAQTMKDYSEATAAASEISGALSLGEKARADTALRKLQSLTRNNAQTNYGNRLSMARQLEEKTGQNLISPLAGQALQSWMPRGMVGSIEKGVGPLAVYLRPESAALLPFMSPRLMGEAAYAMGRFAGPAGSGLLANPPDYLLPLLTTSPSVMFSRTPMPAPFSAVGP